MSHPNGWHDGSFGQKRPWPAEAMGRGVPDMSTKRSRVEQYQPLQQQYMPMDMGYDQFSLGQQQQQQQQQSFDMFNFSGGFQTSSMPPLQQSNSMPLPQSNSMPLQLNNSMPQGMPQSMSPPLHQAMPQSMPQMRTVSPSMSQTLPQSISPSMSQGIPPSVSPSMSQAMPQSMTPPMPQVQPSPPISQSMLQIQPNLPTMSSMPNLSNMSNMSPMNSASSMPSPQMIPDWMSQQSWQQPQMGYSQNSFQNVPQASPQTVPPSPSGSQRMSSDWQQQGISASPQMPPAWQQQQNMYGLPVQASPTSQHAPPPPQHSMQQTGWQQQPSPVQPQSQKPQHRRSPQTSFSRPPQSPSMSQLHQSPSMPSLTRPQQSPSMSQPPVPQLGVAQGGSMPQAHRMPTPRLPTPPQRHKLPTPPQLHSHMSQSPMQRPHHGSLPPRQGAPQTSASQPNMSPGQFGSMPPMPQRQPPPPTAAPMGSMPAPYPGINLSHGPVQTSTPPMRGAQVPAPLPPQAAYSQPQHGTPVPKGKTSTPSARPQPPAPMPAAPAHTAPAAAVQHEPLPPVETVPDVPLLFHMATSAHSSAMYHLLQVCVPSSIQTAGQDTMLRETPKGRVPFTHDAGALHTAMRLLVMALDLLRIGFYLPNLSDLERSAFGLQFAVVAAKVLAAEMAVKRVLAKDEQARVGIAVDSKRLLTDAEDVMSKTLASSQASHLKVYRHGIELASARLAFMKDKANHGKRVVKQALRATQTEEYAHRYNLYLMYMDYLFSSGSVELLTIVDEFEGEAKRAGHTDIVLTAHIIRLKAHYCLRRWDNMQESLDKAAALFSTDQVLEGEPETAPYRLALLLHYLNLRALFHGRLGDDAAAKEHCSRLYTSMDRAMDAGTLNSLRASGGVVKIPLRGKSGPMQYVHIQSTPVNVLWSTTYLAGVTARRDIAGKARVCRNLTYARALRQFEDRAQASDIWDTGFSGVQGVADALQIRNDVNKIRVEMAMEEALALLSRSSFEAADKVLNNVIRLINDGKLFMTHIHQAALLHGQFMQALGFSDKAVRYYRGALGFLIPGSELHLIVTLNMLSAQGGLEGLHQDHERAEQLDRLADQCRSGTSGFLNAVGQLLSCLTDKERVMAKRKLSAAYAIARRGRYDLLRDIIFAFSTSAHVFGDRKGQLHQMETGRDIAYTLGGLDREDGVGQLILGLWFNVKLRDHYRVDSRFDDEAQAQANVGRHLARIAEVREFARRRQ